jgi:hypothetical protein
MLDTDKPAHSPLAIVPRPPACQLQVARDDKGRPSLAEIEGSEQIIECDVVILAMGFTGPEPALVKDFALEVTPQVSFSPLYVCVYGTCVCPATWRVAQCAMCRALPRGTAGPAIALRAQ